MVCTLPVEVHAQCRAKTRVAIGRDLLPSDTFGLVHRIDKPASSPEALYMASKTANLPCMCKLLNDFLKQQLDPKTLRRFRFSTISINQDFASTRHRDTGNAGPSAIYAAGPLKGGTLRY